MRKPDSAPSVADGKDVGAFDNREATEWADTLNDVRDYGAVMDGQTDDSDALEAAMQDSTGPDEAAYIPAEGGTLYLASTVIIRSSDNGTSIVGDGYDSHVKGADGQNQILISGTNGRITDVTVANIRFEGYGDPTNNQWGVRSIDNGYDDENILIENCWSHNQNSSGIDVNTPGTIVRHCSCWSNQNWHGISGNNEPPNDTPRTRFENILAWDNAGYGVDASSGSFVVDTVMSLENGWDSGGGFKTSTNNLDTDVERLHVENNYGHGVNKTGDSENLWYDKVVAINNEGEGIVLNNDGYVAAGDLYAVGNAGNGVFIYNTIDVDIQYIEACNNDSNYGLNTSDSPTGTVQEIRGEGNNMGLVGNTADITVQQESSGSCNLPDVIPERAMVRSSIASTTSTGLLQTTSSGVYARKGNAINAPDSYDVHIGFSDPSYTDYFHDIWEGGLDTRSIVDATGREGNQLEVTVLQNENYGTDMRHYHADTAGYTPTECYHRFWLYIGPGFGSNITHDGKLPGFGGMRNTDEGGGGGGANGTGWSARMGWRHPRNYDTSQGLALEWYVYHMGIGDSDYGEHFSWDVILTEGQWYMIEQYIDLGTPNQNDGVLRGWVDGALEFEKTDFRFRDSDGNDITESLWNIYHGGTNTPDGDLVIIGDNFYIDRSGDGT